MKIFWHLYKNQKKINLYRYFKGNWSKFILKQSKNFIKKNLVITVLMMAI